MRGIGIDVCKAALDFGMTGEDLHRRFSNDEQGIRKLRALVETLGEVRVVVEATGGYEQLVLDRLSEAGVAIMRVNPARARAFARSMGYSMKTDRVDAHVLAEMALSLRQRFRPYQRNASWQEELGHYVTRHNQVQDALTQSRHQLAHFREAELLRGMKRTIATLERELKALEVAIKRLSSPHVTPALAETKGVGPKLCAALLSMLPELGMVSNKSISSLVGVAPFNQDSGGKVGYRAISGGRGVLRQILYMGALSAMRHDPAIAEFYARLKAAGKPFKVRIVAVMRKMLVRLNARRRDELKSALGSAAALQPA